LAEKNDGPAVGREPVVVLPFSPVELEKKQALSVALGSGAEPVFRPSNFGSPRVLFVCGCNVSQRS